MRIVDPKCPLLPVLALGLFCTLVYSLRTPRREEHHVKWTRSDEADAASQSPIIKSYDLHQMAVAPDNSRLWYPEVPALSHIQRHYNSWHTQKTRREGGKTSSVNLTTPIRFIPGVSNPEDIAKAHGLNNAELTGMLMQHRQPNGTEKPANGTRIGRRLGPVAAVAISAISNLILFPAFNAACSYFFPDGSSKLSKGLCYGIANILPILLDFGLGFSAYKQVKQAQRARLIANEIELNLASAFQVVDIRRSLGSSTHSSVWTPALRQKMELYYNEARKDDETLAKQGRIHHDANTGRPLSHWDLLLSHIHPIKHSFAKGYDMSFWHELYEDAYHRHVYVHMHGGNSQLPARSYCLNSTDDTADGDQEAESCEVGGSVGPTGVYSAYRFYGSDDDLMDLHVRFGNETVAQELGFLEADYQLAYNATAVCEFTEIGTDEPANQNNVAMVKLNQVEGNGETTYSLDDCSNMLSS